MTEKQLKYLLYQYPDINDELNKIGLDIEEIKRRKEDAREISSMIIDGMPHASTTSNPTLRKVEEIVDTFENDITLLVNKISKIQKEQNITKKALDKLTEDEYQVIKFKYFNNRKWIDIVNLIHLSQRTCIRLHDKAIKKMLED